MKTSDQIKVRNCQIENIKHPEWGTWGVMEDCGDWFVIRNERGSRILFKDEANVEWTVK